MTTLRVERSGPLSILRLDKPRGNSIDEALTTELIRACRELSADETVRGVLLASAHPKLFCPGLDLVGLLEYDRPAMERFLALFAEAIGSLYALPKPMVAAIGGHAVAGGCVLALAADYRILRRGGAQIGLAEVRVGLPLPWSVAVLLRASVPASSLAQVALLGRNFADDEALAVGLVDALADAEDFEDFCLARLEEFAEKDPTAFRTIKTYLRADALAAMRTREKDLAHEFLDVWFSEAARERIHQIAADLSKSS